MEEKDWNQDELREREVWLERKAAELEEREKDLEEREEVVFKNAKERLYDRIHIPVKVLDLIIISCLMGIFFIFLLKGEW